MAKPALHDADLIGGVDALFSNIPKADAPSQMLDIGKIQLPQKQPRRYFDPEALEALKRSIEKNGILQPLVVRPLEDGTYELVAGERRYQSATLLELTEVPVVVRKLSSTEAYEIALVENLQREDLNPVDETEGILELLERVLEKPQEDIKALLYCANHKDRLSGNNVISSSDWAKVEQVFSSIGKSTPESFATNRLPLLKMPEEVLDTVRAGELEYTKAKVIGRIKDAEAREALLTEAIAEKLSLSAIKEKVSALKKQSTKPPKAVVAKVLKRLDVAYKQAKKPEQWNKPDRRKQLEEILEQLEFLLESDD